jgi:hypothetical protein
LAIYHLSAKLISRGKGQSAIAAAAYRSGERLFDEQDEQQKFYKARAERIVHAEIMAPANAPEWAHDRGQLWNHAERAEKRKDAQLAREFEIALPHELTEQQREWLVKDFAREAFVRKGYAVDFAIHAPDKDSDARNHHAHIMVTMRTLGPDGFAPKKDRSMNGHKERREQLETWRGQWERLANRHLERHGHKERIDCRTLEAQGIEREPTTHLGYAALEMTERGAHSDRMEQHRDIVERNGVRAEIAAADKEIKALENEQAKQARAEAARQAELSRQIEAAKQAEAIRQTKTEQARQSPFNSPRLDSPQEVEAFKRAEAIKQAEANQGNIRMYRGIGYNVGEAKAGEKVFFSTDPKVAEAYGVVHFVDITRAELSKFEHEKHDDWRTANPEIIARLKPLARQRSFEEIQAAHRAAEATRQPATPQPVKEQPRAPVAAPPPKEWTQDAIKATSFSFDIGARAAGRMTSFAEKAANAPMNFLSSLTDTRPKFAFSLDPEERRKQHRAMMEAERVADAERRAIFNMERDLESGRSLRREDIQLLTPNHQEQLALFGDGYVQKMVEELRAEERRKRDERERER